MLAIVAVPAKLKLVPLELAPRHGPALERLQEHNDETIHEHCFPPVGSDDVYLCGRDGLGPWTEYNANPLIRNKWPPHYSVSHVSSPHAIWNEEESKLFLYFHGENKTTRFATSRDGIHFTYGGIAVTTTMFDQVTEASYARVFRYTLPGKDNRYIMTVMGHTPIGRRLNNKIGLAVAPATP